MALNTLFYAVVILMIYPARLVQASSFNFTIQPSDHVVAIGKPLLLNCQAQYSGSEAVHISWKNNNNWLVDPSNKPWTQLANHSLYYSSIPAQSIGTFKCGATVTGTSLFIYSRKAKVQAAYINSQFYTHPANVTRRLGEVATFDCVTKESLPYASIYWEKDGKYFAQGNSFHIPNTNSTSSALLVKSITFTSSGWYGCVATNPLLQNQPQRSNKGYLTVLPALDKPHFGVQPTNMIVPEHLPSVMQCQILGVPSPFITWTQNGQQINNASERYILSNGSLYFAPPVKRLYAGQYVCSGTNSKGSVSSQAVLFRIAYFDFSFIENPSNRTAVVGDVVSIKCVPPTSFPVQVNIHWYHNYQLITPGAAISIDSSGTITFTSIKKSDEGMYFCDGTNSYLHVTRTSLAAYVTVHVPPTIQLKPRDTNVTNGHSLSLHCQATGFPQPTVTWQKDGHPVDTSHVTLLSNGSMYISSTVTQDAGKFSCSASNIVGSATVSAVIVIYVPPSLVSSGANATKTVGESVRFECSFSGIPQPVIQWFYSSGGSIVQLMQTAHYVISAGNLEIRGIEKKDEGKYICQAGNIAGHVQASAYLRVKVPASLHLKPMNVTVNESSSASFQCNASGDPKPVVTWFKGRTQLSSGGRVVIGEESLTVLNTVASDAGQYSCNVSNGLSIHVGVAHLIVQVAPNITSFNVPRLVRAEMNATLICAVSGIPQPIIIWQRDDAMLSRVHHVISSMFVIINVEKADSGMYTCVASNAAGVSLKHANLTVQVAPSSPIPISAIPLSSSVIQLSWKPSFDGHSPITSYKLEITSVPGTYVVLQENLTVTSYTVGSLHPFTTYKFRITARNAVGLSPGATITNKTLQDAPSSPRNVVAIPWNATAIRVTWSIPATPNGHITWYEIQYNAAGGIDVTSKVLLTNQLPELKTFIDSLKPFTRYQLRIRAATLKGMWGNFSSIAEATTHESAPSVAPDGIQLQALSADSILVKWKFIPSNLSNGNVRRYVIFVKATGPYRFSDARNVSAGTSQNFTVRGLFAWTKYNVSIQAVTVQAGPMSPWKQVRTLEAAPGPPSNITLVSDSQHSIMVFITEPTPVERNGIIIGYTVFYRQTSLLPGYLLVNTSDSSVRITNLTVFTEYSVKVAAFTSAGQGQESQHKTIISQEGIPGTVDDVTATVVDHNTISVTWRPPNKPNGQIKEYKIIYNSTDAESSGSAITSGDELSIHNLTPNTTYFIFVVAKTSKGFGKKGAAVTVRTSILPPPITEPTTPQSTTTEESSTVGVPVGTEKRTGGIDENQMIIIIVCVALIVLFITVLAVYFLGIKRRKEEDAVAYARSRKKPNFKSPAFEMERPRLDVHEEPSEADTNSSDSFDSDWDTSVASPNSANSPFNESQQYADPADSTLRGSDRFPQVNLRNKKLSLDSQESHYDQPYSNVEELGGGFSSFGPPPPEGFRSSPIEDRDADLERQENSLDTATLPSSRKSFTNELFNAVHTPKHVDLGEGGTSYEGFHEKDISGVENKGYDSDEELNECLTNSQVKSGTSDNNTSTVPKNLEELYAKVDKSKKKTFRKKDATSSSDSESNHSTKEAPNMPNDSFVKPDKSKKTFRKTSRDPQGNQESGQTGELSHDPVVVYDERTNFENEAEPKDNDNPAVDKHDAQSVGESTLSTDTIVSDLNSSEVALASENRISLNRETLPVTVLDPPPPSPFTLKNKKFSIGSTDSFYDEPYSSLEEIDAGITPIPSPPYSNHRVGPEKEPKIPDDVSDVTPTAYKTSFPNQPYGVLDKPEDEAVVMEVKDIENPIQDFDEVLHSLLVNEQQTAELDNKPSAFTRSDSLDSTVLMF